MILQFGTTAEILLFILWVVLATMLLGLFIWLATRWISSKTKAKDKIVMIFVLALVAVLLLPLVSGLIGTVLGWIDTVVGWPATQLHFLGDGGGYLLTLVAVIQYLIFVVLVKFFINETWNNSVWISLISLFLLFLLYTLIPALYESLNFYMPW